MTNIPLVEEILHQLIGSLTQLFTASYLSQLVQDFFYPQYFKVGASLKEGTIIGPCASIIYVLFLDEGRRVRQSWKWCKRLQTANSVVRWAGVRMHSRSCELFCILVGAARFPNVVLDFAPTKGCSPEYLKLKVVTKRFGCGIAAGQPLLLKFGPAYNNGRIQRSNNTETFQRCIGCGHGEEQRSISDGHFPY